MKIIDLLKQVVIGIPTTQLFEFECDLETFKEQIRENIGKYDEFINSKGNFSGLNRTRINIYWTRRLKNITYKYGPTYSSLSVRANIIDSDKKYVKLESKFYSSDRYIFWIFYGFLFIVASVNFAIRFFITKHEMNYTNLLFGVKICFGILIGLSVIYILVANKNIKEFKHTIFNQLEYKTI